MTEIEPGCVELRTVFADRHGRTRVELDWFEIESSEHLRDTIKFLHQQFTEYYGAKSDLKTTWRYYKE